MSRIPQNSSLNILEVSLSIEYIFLRKVASIDSEQLEVRLAGEINSTSPSGKTMGRGAVGGRGSNRSAKEVNCRRGEEAALLKRGSAGGGIASKGSG